MEDQTQASAPGEVGRLIAARRRACGLTLDELARRVGRSKGYLSEIENGRKRTPSDAVLMQVEEALDLPRGKLIEAARWARTPGAVKRDFAKLQTDQRAVRRLSEVLASGSLDDAYRSGELARLVGRLASHAGSDAPAPVALPLEVPLINDVTAGYPTEFTDLGYPARIADEYVRCPDLLDPDAFAARVVGDSMTPTYLEGDIVIFSPARDVRDGSDCFVRLEPDHETTFKRIFFERDEAGREVIRIQPINNRYPPRVEPRERVAGLYAAVSVMRSI
jgi:SOS-response transcriptional repressor LexA